MIDTVKNILGLIVTTSTVLGIFTALVNKLFDRKLKPLKDTFEKRFEEDEKKLLKQEMNNCRYRVVTFASDLHKNIPKTRFEYEMIFQYANDYEECVKRLGIVNHLFDTELKYITDCYRKLDKRD